MPTENYRLLAALIAAHPKHEVVGRTRLQKTVWLLQRLGFPTDYPFTIYFYGPYSEALQAEIDLLDAIGLVDEESHISHEAIPYYTIRAVGNTHLQEQEIAKFRRAIDTLAETDLTLLELAATYDAFRELGCDHSEALARVRRKKGKKCEQGRLEQALQLLGAIGLSTE